MTTTKRMPKGWRENQGGDIACHHRDCSCCSECAKRIDVVEVYGQHFWVPSAIDRLVLLKQIHAGA